MTRRAPYPFYDPFRGEGKVLFAYPDRVVWYTEMDGELIACTQSIVRPIIEDNKRELSDNAGKRWGDGRVARRIPLDFYFERIMPALMAGDNTYVKRILNDSEYQDFRVFPGKI